MWTPASVCKAVSWLQGWHLACFGISSWPLKAGKCWTAAVTWLLGWTDGPRWEPGLLRRRRTRVSSAPIGRGESSYAVQMATRGLETRRWDGVGCRWKRGACWTGAAWSSAGETAVGVEADAETDRQPGLWVSKRREGACSESEASLSSSLLVFSVLKSWVALVLFSKAAFLVYLQKIRSNYLNINLVYLLIAWDK